MSCQAGSCMSGYMRDNRSLDILAVYQYVNYRSTTSTQPREHFWKTLDDSIRPLPNRNNFLCAGDFNCDLKSQQPWVGSTTFKWMDKHVAGSQHQDHQRFLALLRTHGLIALNTWGSSGATYIHGKFASRIDHILTRIVSCDGQAKQVKYLDQADFVPHTQTHHIPMFCTIRKHHIPYQQHDKAHQM